MAIRFSWAESQPTPQLKTGADGVPKEPNLRLAEISPYCSRVPALFGSCAICTVPSSSSLNSYLYHGNLADLEPSKDRTVCLYWECLQESDGRRPFWTDDRRTSGSACSVGRGEHLSGPNAQRAPRRNP